MALDVGAVTIDYSVRPPGGVVETYARTLKAFDSYNHEDCWRVSSDGHVFLELSYGTMSEHAQRYTSSQGMAAADARQVTDWVERLPWRSGVVMLHFGW